jgi:2,3-bisphosphoglycerate-dependent phosphoglycerate mutase
MVKLVLVRHGESVWNKLNEFTGWVDVPLTPKGIRESNKAGKLLAKKKIKFDVVFTSELIRAEQTLIHILSSMQIKQIPVFYSEQKKDFKYEKHIHNKNELPIYKDDDLNERYYGALQGMNKDLARKRFGLEQVEIWRRSYDKKPPHGESLKDTMDRAVPYFKKHVLPQLKKGKNVLIAAHGNSLRGITKYLEHIKNKDIPHYEIATGVPTVYDLDSKMKIKSKVILK